MGKREGLSIIIPIYNVENYIEECLLSVVESLGSLPNIEILLINDGSLDNSGNIAKRYAETYDNFIYIYKPNGGLADARNYGIDHARYDYIGFIDSDDWVDSVYFTKIVEALEKNPDLIIFDVLDVVKGKTSEVLKGMDFEDVLWSAVPSACNKIFKRELFEKVRFPEGRIYEDVGTVYKLFYWVDHYIYLSEPLYQYRKHREGSILSTVSNRINDLYEALENTYEFYYEKNGLVEESRVGLCYQYIKLLSWSNMYRQLQYYKYNFFGFYLKMRKTRQLLYYRFPDWRENGYLNRNKLFFEKRFGDNYINKIDNIGSSPLKTLNVIIFVITKNRKRVVQSE